MNRLISILLLALPLVAADPVRIEAAESDTARGWIERVQELQEQLAIAALARDEYMHYLGAKYDLGAFTFSEDYRSMVPYEQAPMPQLRFWQDTDPGAAQPLPLPGTDELIQLIPPDCPAGYDLLGDTITCIATTDEQATTGAVTYTLAQYRNMPVDVDSTYRWNQFAKSWNSWVLLMNDFADKAKLFMRDSEEGKVPLDKWREVFSRGKRLFCDE